MDYAPEEYSRYYIVEALFRLMSQYEYDKIKVTDIVAKAGVGRVTFYRYFKKKEDVILYYFEHNARSFELSQKYYPRCKDDYITVATEVFAKFRENAQVFRLIRKARLEYVYLDYLNKSFAESFATEHGDRSAYLPYVYAGMLFNVSMAWLDKGCSTPPAELAATVVNAVYGQRA